MTPKTPLEIGTPMRVAVTTAHPTFDAGKEPFDTRTVLVDRVSRCARVVFESIAVGREHWHQILSAQDENIRLSGGSRSVPILGEALVGLRVIAEIERLQPIANEKPLERSLQHAHGHPDRGPPRSGSTTRV
jgi:hypothetical protein